VCTSESNSCAEMRHRYEHANTCHRELTLLKFLLLIGDNVSPNLSARLRRMSELAAYKYKVVMQFDKHVILLKA
jgi:hypothetical protein